MLAPDRDAPRRGLAGLVSRALFSRRDRRRGYLVMNIPGSLVVVLTLIANLYRAWTKAGRPRGTATWRPQPKPQRQQNPL